MFRMLKQRINDIRAIKTLCASAETHANADGEKAPGLEHFVLAALDLPDGTARRAFRRLGADPDAFRPAVSRQYDDALRSIGIDPSRLGSLHGSDAGIPQGKGIYRSQPQVQALMEKLAGRQRTDAGEALLGAHVIEAIATFQHGAASRTLSAMGIDREALREAAREEANSTRAGVHAA